MSTWTFSVVVNLKQISELIGVYTTFDLETIVGS